MTPFWPFLALFGPFWPFLALFGGKYARKYGFKGAFCEGGPKKVVILEGHIPVNADLPPNYAGEAQKGGHLGGSDPRKCWFKGIYLVHSKVGFLYR